MDYQLLLHLCTELGYRLAMACAETFRVEESINLIMGAYGLQAEAFSIPNNLTVSIVTPEGIPMTRMKRIGNHGSNLDSVERYTNLSRRICAETPDPATAQQWLKETYSRALQQAVDGSGALYRRCRIFSVFWRRIFRYDLCSHLRNDRRLGRYVYG